MEVKSTFQSEFDVYDQIDVDQEGNVYVASWDGGWVNKFVPKSDGDPGKLVGRGLVLRN